jgi:endonuclease III-like uncharacterized protein
MPTSPHQAKLEMFETLRAMIHDDPLTSADRSMLSVTTTEIYYNAVAARADLYNALDEQLALHGGVGTSALVALLTFAQQNDDELIAAQYAERFVERLEKEDENSVFVMAKVISDQGERAFFIQALDVAVYAAVHKAAKITGQTDVEIIDDLLGQIPS